MPQFLEGGSSVPLGVLPFPEFEEVSVPIEQGATVVLYTDGLVERPGEHIDAGLGQARGGRAGRAGTDPQQLCDLVLRELVPEVGAPPTTWRCSTLRTIPMADRFSVELPTEPEALASMRALLRRWLRHVDGSEQEIAEVVTACGEAATNAIEHAGRGRPVRDQRPGRGPPRGDRGARLRRLAAPRRGRPRQGAVADARFDGYG